MPLFKDRQDAGQQLANALAEFAGATDVLLIALPRGGVVVGYEVAKTLCLPLDIICPRKIGAPFNPEFAIGAITETGETVLSEEVMRELNLTKQSLLPIIEKEKKEAAWRLKHYRQERPPRTMKGKRVILIDDGLATGSTMLAAIKTAKNEAKEVMVAIPVAPPNTLAKIKKEVSCVFCLASPSSFYAVGQFYRLFDQTSDDEVISLLNAAQALMKISR